MRLFQWLSGKKEREKREKKKREKYEKMPDFKKIFCSLPNIIKAATVKPKDIETQHVPSVQDRAAAKNDAEKKTKTAASKDKTDDIYTRIETAKSKNLEIIWLLQTNEDVSFKSLRELIENYRNEQDSVSIKGISVHYVSEGKLHEISSLNEQDLDGLAKKLEGNR